MLPVASRGFMQRSRGKQSLPLRIICVFCHLESLLLTRPLHSSSCILLSFCYLSLLSSVLRLFTPSPGVVPVPCGWSGWCGWHGTVGGVCVTPRRKQGATRQSLPQVLVQTQAATDERASRSAPLWLLYRQRRGPGDNVFVSPKTHTVVRCCVINVTTFKAGNTVICLYMIFVEK